MRCQHETLVPTINKWGERVLRCSSCGKDFPCITSAPESEALKMPPDKGRGWRRKFVRKGLK